MTNKLFVLWMITVLSLSLTGLAWSQEKAKTEEPAGLSKLSVEKSAEEANSEAQAVSPAASIRRMGGVVTAVDPQAHTISIHQETVHHDWVMQLKVNGDVAKELSNIKRGDLVNIWVNGKFVTALNKVG